MILNNLPCGFIPGSRASIGHMGREATGLCGASFLLGVFPLFPSKPCSGLKLPVFLGVPLLPSKLTFLVFTG